jgi:hypothetical protein
MALLSVFTIEECSQKVYTDYVNEDVVQLNDRNHMLQMSRDNTSRHQLSMNWQNCNGAKAAVLRPRWIRSRCASMW